MRLLTLMLSVLLRPGYRRRWDLLRFGYLDSSLLSAAIVQLASLGGGAEVYVRVGLPANSVYFHDQFEAACV